MDPKTILITAAVASLGELRTSLQGLDLTGIPAPLAAQVKEMKDALDASLAKLAPTDAVPAALDASYALNSLAHTLRRVTEFAESTMSQLRAMAQKLEPQSLALNELKGRVDRGDLLEVAEVERRVQVGIARLDGRRAELVKLGLPTPPMHVLLGSDEVFALTSKEAQRRLGEVSGRCLPEKEEARVALFYGTGEVFDVLRDVLPKASPTDPKKPEPLLGKTPPDQPAESKMTWA